MAFAFRHLKLTKPLAVLDLETTGLNPASDRVVEVGIFRVDPGGETIRYSALVHPDVSISEAATAVHGIDNAMVADQPRFGRLAPRLAELLDDADLAGFNVRFDLAFLAAEFRRVGLDLRLQDRAVIDAMKIFKTYERRDLAAAVTFYCQRTHDGAHTALDDAVATAEVLDAQVACYEGLPDTIEGLHALFTDVDVGDRFRTERGRVTFAFGKHLGRPLDEVARTDPGYLRWFMGQDFLDDAKALVERALEEAGPRR